MHSLAESSQEEAEFARRLLIAREREQRTEVQVSGKRVVWAPQEGSQTEFMTCPLVDTLYHGTRGPGKTDALLMTFAQHVGKGFGAAWRGILFRQTYPQLADVQAKSEKWFRQIFPRAQFNKSHMRWDWPSGEVLFFRHMLNPAAYWNYHGHEYPWIGWEELANWANDECFKAMISCCRSSTYGVPRMVRSTTNPYGVGHNWIKERYKLHGQWWKTIVQEHPRDLQGHEEPSRCAIHGHLRENKILLRADPDYESTIIASATSEAKAEAWLRGSWDFVAGGMFDDVWDSEKNIVPRFEVPHSWRLDRSFDWGSSRPFSVGWWAQSDGSDLLLSDGRVVSTVRGDLFRVREWYGFSGKPNEGKRMLAVDIAKEIIEREIRWGWRTPTTRRVQAGPADSSIYTEENGMCIARDMAKACRVQGEMHLGVQWRPADKSPGSRKRGWEMVRKMMRNAHPEEAGPRESPGLFVVGQECEQFLRTMFAIPRDERDLDDLDTSAEDHIADEVRYRVSAMGGEIRQAITTGIY